MDWSQLEKISYPEGKPLGVEEMIKVLLFAHLQEKVGKGIIEIEIRGLL